MGTIDFRNHKIETKKRPHDWMGRVTGPNTSGRLFVGESQLDVERQARDYIKTIHPWRDVDEEPEESGAA